MDMEKIQKLIDMAKSNDLAEISYKKGDEKIVVVTQRQPMVNTGYAVSAPSSQISSASPARENARSANQQSYHEIKSPLVGTFYAQAAPGDPPFAKAGDKLKKGQTVCIIEAMKIMNDIESDVAGEIVEVCVENESLVEFGQVLFRIRT